MNRNDKCKCGHLRKDHNNRIDGSYVSSMKYNCCMADIFCDCLKFEKSKGAD